MFYKVHWDVISVRASDALPKTQSAHQPHPFIYHHITPIKNIYSKEKYSR